MSSPRSSGGEAPPGAPGGGAPRRASGTRPSPRSASRSGFRTAVTAVVRSVPAGEVITYGEVAAEAGHPGAARAVASVLRAVDGLPWWRVVSARGRVCPGAMAEATGRLGAEGVSVVDGHVRHMTGATRRGAPRRSPSRPSQADGAPRPGPSTVDREHAT